jgi:hypothetical protein
MANLVFNSYDVDLAKADVDFLVDTIKVALVTSSYTPDQDAHSFFSSVTNEVSAAGYTAGGFTLTTKTVTKDNTGNRAVLDSDPAVWSAASFTARGAVVYKDTGTAATSPLMLYKDFGSDKTVTAGTFTLNWHATDKMLTINS